MSGRINFATQVGLGEARSTRRAHIREALPFRGLNGPELLFLYAFRGAACLRLGVCCLRFALKSLGSAA